MREKSGVFALLTGVLAVGLMAGCGFKSKEEKLSLIDENHFDQLASTESAPGNASAAIEFIGGNNAMTGNLAQRVGMPLDGIPADTIAASGAVAPKAIQPVAPGETVSVKATATYEEKVQAALKNAGYYSGTIDGKIGSHTREAIKAFQAANSLKSDGVVGPSTWEKLKKFLTTK